MLEHAAADGAPGNSESSHPAMFNGTKQEDNKNSKLGAVTAGHSSKIGNVGPSVMGSSKHGDKVKE
jgi:hypothetical protein